jgi:hypothetical protein
MLHMQLPYGASTILEIPDLSWRSVLARFGFHLRRETVCLTTVQKVLGAGSLLLFYGLQKELQLLHLRRKIKRAFTFQSSGPSSNAVWSLVQQFQSVRTGTPVPPMGAESMMEPMWDFLF